MYQADPSKLNVKSPEEIRLVNVKWFDRSSGINKPRSF